MRASPATEQDRLVEMADLLGNHDGVANSTELGLTEGFYNGWGNRASLSLDGEPYPVASTALTGVDGAGPVTDSAPVILKGTMDLRFPALPSPAFPKNITISMPWTPPFYRAQYDIKLPAGTVATLSTGNQGAVTRVSATEWTLTPAAVSYDTFPRSSGILTIEVTSVAGGPGGATLDMLPILLVFVAGPVAAVLLITFYILWRQRRRMQGGTSPPPVEPPPAT